MGASPTPRNAEPGPVVAVAFSGGRDSTALLHATVHAAQRQGGLQVAALHVHHGLNPEADAWQAHADALCRRWRARGLPLIFRSLRLASRPAPGDSVEAWARRERYAALANLARSVGAGRVLLAQHRRDQAETVLLQVLRGGGSAGLAAMPSSIERDGLRWERPWLDRPREAIEAYVRRYRLKYVDDGSNDDPRFARNRLRLQVWPALGGAFPDAESALAAVAQRAQEADAVLREVAAADLQALAEGTVLDLNAWRQLSPARGANALRAWLAQQLGRRPAEALVQRLLTELPGTARGSARWPVDEQRECRAYRGQLQCGLRVAASAPEARVLDLSRPGRHVLPDWGGALEVRSVRSGGVAAEALAALVLGTRQGGERFQLATDGLARSLKKQFQARGVPEWERTGPLLYAQGRLLFVPGLGIDARWWHEGAGPRRQLRWLPGAG